MVLWNEEDKMNKICSKEGCYNKAKYYSDKAEWFCEEHKPDKLFGYRRN